MQLYLFARLYASDNFFRLRGISLHYEGLLRPILQGIGVRDLIGEVDSVSNHRYAWVVEAKTFPSFTQRSDGFVTERLFGIQSEASLW